MTSFWQFISLERLLIWVPRASLPFACHPWVFPNYGFDNSFLSFSPLLIFCDESWNFLLCLPPPPRLLLGWLFCRGKNNYFEVNIQWCVGYIYRTCILNFSRRTYFRHSVQAFWQFTCIRNHILICDSGIRTLVTVVFFLLLLFYKVVAGRNHLISSFSVVEAFSFTKSQVQYVLSQISSRFSLLTWLSTLPLGLRIF